jgi:hypothetical protein
MIAIIIFAFSLVKARRIHGRDAFPQCINTLPPHAVHGKYMQQSCVNQQAIFTVVPPLPSFGTGA